MEFIRRDSKTLLHLSGFIALFIVAITDYLSAFEFGFSALYLLTILIFTWIGDKFTGFSLSVIGILLWLGVDILSGHNPLVPQSIYWNIAAEFALFIVSMFLLLKLKSAYERERALSRVDPLTGLANRRFFLELTAIELDWCRRHQIPLTIAYLDIDNFKIVNDTLGHRAGDTLLTEAAKTIKENVRSIDIVARIGGDEFLIMFPELGAEKAPEVINRLQSHLLKRMEANRWPVTFSTGAATYERLDDTLEEMIAKADALMYRAKKAGKNSFKYEVINREHGHTLT